MTTLVLPAYWKMMRFILLIPGTLQNIIGKPGLTHQFCNMQAVNILRKDYEYTCADFLNTYIQSINAGSLWADDSCKNTSHFFNPETGKGKWHLPHALWEYKVHYDKACKCALQKDYAKAAFYLGASSHLIQDLCVPHHTKGTILNGHYSFEQWAEIHRTQYASNNHGIYNLGNSMYSWLLHNALCSQKYYPLVSENINHKNYATATSVLLPMAQETSAGFYHQFIKNYL